MVTQRPSLLKDGLSVRGSFSVQVSMVRTKDQMEAFSIVSGSPMPKHIPEAAFQTDTINQVSDRRTSFHSPLVRITRLVVIGVRS